MLELNKRLENSSRGVCHLAARSTKKADRTVVLVNQPVRNTAVFIRPIRVQRGTSGASGCSSSVRLFYSPREVLGIGPEDNSGSSAAHVVTLTRQVPAVDNPQHRPSPRGLYTNRPILDKNCYNKLSCTPEPYPLGVTPGGFLGATRRWCGLSTIVHVFEAKQNPCGLEIL